MRLTRAALRAEAQPQENETTDASNPHTEPKERVPLGEVSANTALEPELAQVGDQKMPSIKSKAKGGAKKGAKGKKTKAAEEEQVEVVEVLEDERQAAGSPASDAAVDELAKPPTDDIVQVPMSDLRSASPPSRAVRMTRRQLAKQDEELSQSQRLAAPPPPPEPVEEIVEEIPVPEQEQDEPIPDAKEVEPVQQLETSIQESEDATAGGQESELDPPAPAHVAGIEAPEVTAPEVEVSSEPEPKTLTSEKPCESSQITPAPSRTPSRSPSKSPGKTPMRLEESIEAIDALEEALENVIPSFNPSADEKSPRKARFGAVVRARMSNGVKKSPLATSKVSRNPSAPKSLKPTTAPRSSIARSSSVREAPTKGARKGSTEVADYLASKRRPISMNFPTPPPPPKGSKAPTKSSFQLPGEAIAAKLKAQKEERLKREQEGGQRPVSGTFTAPTVKSSKPPTESNFQLPGEAIAAKLKAQKEERLKREQEGGGQRPVSGTFTAPAIRSSKPPTKSNFQLSGDATAAKLKAQKEERLKREAEGATSRPSSAAFQAPRPPKSLKLPTVPNFQLSGEAVAAKLKAQREQRLKREEEEAAKKPAFKARPAPTQKSGPTVIRQTAASKARESMMNVGDKKDNSATIPLQRTSSLNAAKRNSTITSRPAFNGSASSSATTSKRNSVVLTSGPTTTNSKRNSIMTATDAAAQRLKGREIFNRDKMEKERRDNDRRDKEDAAKKARAEAAERGRVASREWAEKQKRKLMGGAAAAAAAPPKQEDEAAV